MSEYELAAVGVAAALVTAPQVGALKGVPQEPEHHPEGDAWGHTVFVVEAAWAIVQRERLHGTNDAAALLWAALCHDLGKAMTTATRTLDDGRIVVTSYGHDQAGVEPALALLARIGVGQGVAGQVGILVREHMAHVGIRRGNDAPRLIRNLEQRLGAVSPQLWAWLVEADASGRPPKPWKAPAQHLVAPLNQARLERRAREARPTPLVQGRHLIEAGIMPEIPADRGPLLRAMFEAQLGGAFDDVNGGLAWLRAQLVASGE